MYHFLCFTFLNVIQNPGELPYKVGKKFTSISVKLYINQHTHMVLRYFNIFISLLCVYACLCTCYLLYLWRSEESFYCEGPGDHTAVFRHSNKCLYPLCYSLALNSCIHFECHFDIYWEWYFLACCYILLSWYSHVGYDIMEKVDNLKMTPVWRRGMSTGYWVVFCCHQPFAVYY